MQQQIEELIYSAPKDDTFNVPVLVTWPAATYNDLNSLTPTADSCWSLHLDRPR